MYFILIQEISSWLVETIGNWGYFGLFILMAIESSVFPLPSELVMIPAGYLAYQGEMNFMLAVLFATCGSLAGAWGNYLFAFFLGRSFLLRYGKYFFVSEKHLVRTEEFFKNHGHIATFTGRLILVIRHLISLPAGLAKMNPLEFSLYTFLGAGVWNILLMSLGFFIGQNRILINQYLHYIIFAVFLFVAILIIGYWLKNRRK